MPRAQLTVQLPGRAWIGAVSREFPDATFTVLAALPTGETGVGLVEITTTEDLAILEAIEAHDSVISLEVMGRTDRRTVIRFETGQPLLLFSVKESGIPLEPPVAIRNAQATVEVTAPRDRLSELGTHLEQFGLRFEVDSITSTVQTTEQLMTDRQRELVVAATEQGYYDTPRRCTLTELADDLGAAKSTVSETLHRAEENIIKEFVAELDGLEHSTASSVTVR